ncbi:SusC/RagA family TonB-linked outer membrane protein [Mucilaginibacter sp. FT3.2]|uniref:SusC/RagA family TonB-linked outer membrane protein n=1 Tax=Mucilaginibacter sp. FT3.2 TaxID=2723090 RepID=UPI00160ABDF4|nr:SusC/RagA family TonB-linked outer membrane protein [Mucilaginibacter sp. FT3.2]MBB6229849.1 TonB-linked SusC/RagA family outer membrane protein [Mucilaginibacter sp. FT3.2]
MRYSVIIFSFILLLCLHNKAGAQQKKIVVTGTVIDKTERKPMPGVMVWAGKPLAVVVQTDIKGNFSVKTDADGELAFSFLGFKKVTKKVEGSTMNVLLVEEVNALKETVIIGYAKKTKEVSTGSSVIITAKDIQDAPVANVMELLQGKVAGLNIQNNNGTPGMVGSINIRGISNVNVSGSGFLTPTSPLFVVDGFPIDDNTSYSYGFDQASPGLSPISMIPTEDIQSIEILKDAQATSLYGSRGAYGVIIITTKRGNSKVPIIKYTANFTFSQPPALRKVIGGKGERLMRIDEILQNDTNYYHALNTINSTPFLSDSLNSYYNNSTNWQALYFRSTFNQTHNVEISGGESKFNYKVNLGYFNQKGIVQNTGFTRYNLNMNALYQPNDRFKLQAAINNQLADNSTGGGNSLTQTGVASTGASSSLLPPPSLFTATSDLLNTLSTQNDNKTVNITANLDIDFLIVKGLRATNSFSFNYLTQGTETFKPGALNSDLNKVYNYFDRKNTVYNRTALAFDKTVANDHNFSANVFGELNSTNFRADVIQQTGTPNDQIKGPLGYDFSQSLGGTLNNLADLKTASLGTSFNYNYKQMYVLELSYRIDGSSTNGPSAGYSKNPSIGLRWNFNKEKFMQKYSWLDYSSFRFSYGKNIVPTGSVYDVYGRYTAGTNYNQVPTVDLDYGVIPNTGLTPTTTTQYNGGFDAGFLNGKFSLTFDTYYKQVDNMLRMKDIANINAFSQVSTNEMSVVDYGYELTLTARPLPTDSKLSWQISVNASFNKDVMVHLPDNVSQLLVVDQTTGQNILYRLGRNSLTNVLLNTKGVYATTASVPVDPLTGLRYRTGGITSTYFKAGDPAWTDVNGDYVLDANDYVAVGNSQPLITGGFNSSLQYGPFSLNINGSFTAIRDVLNNDLASRFQSFADPTAQTGLVPLSAYNYWKASGNNATYPNPYDYTRTKQTSPFRYDQTLFQEDGSYLKINQVTLSYNFKKTVIKRWGISSARIYGTVYNVHTFSNYSGANPENVTDLGRDISGGYPTPRSYTLGLQVQF